MIDVKLKTEAYNRKDKYVLHDIIAVAKCNSLSDLTPDDMQYYNVKYFISNIKSTGDAAKIEAIERLIQTYNWNKNNDDNNEDLYRRASEVRDQVLKIFEDNGFEYTDRGNGYYYFDTPEDISLNQLLDFFESKMNIKTYGTARGGSWTSINYLTDTKVEIQIGYAGPGREREWQFDIYGLNDDMF